jgi:hypothetical protein
VSGNGSGGFWKAGARLAAHYDRLEPEERFRAALEAAAREDYDERGRLVDSCPRLTYEMSDVGFLDRVDASRDMALAVALDLGPRLAQLRLTAAVREALPHAVALGVDFSAAATGDDALTPEEVCEIVGETTARAFDAAEAILRSQAAAVLAAFSAVCRDGLGLDPECVLRAHLGPLLVEQLGLDQLDGAKPDREALAAWREMLARKWAERVGG